MAYGRVADGSIDISIDGGLDPYDYCALVPIVKGAGAASRIGRVDRSLSLRALSASRVPTKLSTDKPSKQ